MSSRLVDVVVLAVAVAEGVLTTITEDSPYVVVTIAIAVLALLVTGSDAHSRYYSEDVQKMAPGTIDLLVVPGADHVDLYDRKDVIPFDRLDEFFTKNLA